MFGTISHSNMFIYIYILGANMTAFAAAGSFTRRLACMLLINPCALGIMRLHHNIAARVAAAMAKMACLARSIWLARVHAQAGVR